MKGKRAATCPLTLTRGEFPYWCSHRRLWGTQTQRHIWVHLENLTLDRDVVQLSGSSHGGPVTLLQGLNRLQLQF